MSDAPQHFTKIRFLLPNGRVVEGRGEEWIAAILQVLPPAVQQQVFAAVERKMVAYETPGHYILQAEGFDLKSVINDLGASKRPS